MYVRKNTNSAGTVYFQLVESYRIGKKVRQRILFSLGKKGDGKLDNLAQAVSRYTDLIKIEDLAKQLDVKQTYILGPLIILERLFEKLGINKAIEEISALHPKISFNMKKILFSLVVSRFIKAGSKLKVYDNQQRSFYPGMFSPDLKLHQLYRCLDVLSKHKEDMEKSLYWHERDLFNLEVDVVLYDLTTLRFESVKAEKGKLRQFGYSKEKRSDCTQVVFGLLVDREGLPLGFEVYPGNTFEGHTVVDIVRKMREKFKVRRFIFVGDRGLFSEENLEMLKGKKREEGNEFIMGMRLGLIKQRHEEFYDKSLFTEVHEGLSVYETEYEKDRLIVIWSKKRADRDRKTREDILSKVKVKLSKKQGKLKGSDFVTNRNYKKYISFPKDRRKSPCLNEEVIKEEEKKDGFFWSGDKYKGYVGRGVGFQLQRTLEGGRCFWGVEGDLKGSSGVSLDR